MSGKSPSVLVFAMCCGQDGKCVKKSAWQGEVGPQRRLWKDLWEHRVGFNPVGGVGEELDPEESSPGGERTRVEECLRLLGQL